MREVFSSQILLAIGALILGYKERKGPIASSVVIRCAK